MGKPYHILVTAFTIARNSTFPAFSTQRSWLLNSINEYKTIASGWLLKNMPAG
ncbi:hypothetical protein [Flavobacterium sp. UBA4197]|uniref:hypothetical protein n=1 Tax=Flavobacterium sp. UBA4197 TaxID=1946546 RepID=UPI00257BCFF5|nr:hypothetical protein [Flavobacterium sp. UBA4197]